MKPVETSAPGKLVLVGEYAVLDGAPALALAVDRRAWVRLVPRDDHGIRIHAPQIDARVAEAVLDDGHVLRWHVDATQAKSFELIAQIHAGLRAVGELDGLRGFDLSIDTAGFVQGSNKLGLGSSAAVTVSLMAAMQAASGAPEPNCEARLQRMLALHSSWQHGQGSGIDIAASLTGGLIVYRRDEAAPVPSVQSRPWPLAGVQCQFLWSGQSISTAGFLQRLAAWKLARPADHAAHFSRLGALSRAAISALDEGATAFVAAVDAYGLALQAMAHASGLQIFTPAQAELAHRARRVGAAFKPCGAGGDMGVLLADDAEGISQLRGGIMATGMQPLDLNADPCGLRRSV